MPYSGKSLMQRECVALVAAHWPNQKVRATSVLLAESKGSIGSYHDNLNDDGTIGSRDCGLFQINIAGSKVGTPAEERLRTDSLDPTVYMPVARNNVLAAYKLWANRKWQPWVAYTTGWAMFPEAWVWSQFKDEVPGPWVPTGRYLHQAIRAVANWHLFINGSLSSQEALSEAERLADQYGVTKGDLAYTATKGVYWIYPPQPTSPPADGLGPRPKPNNGQ